MYQINLLLTDRVIPAAKNEKELDEPIPLKKGGAQLVHRTPRLSFFSGEDPPGKSEKTYEQWIFDVKTVQPSYPEGLLKEAIFGSLKGNAGRYCMRARTGNNSR